MNKIPITQEDINIVCADNPMFATLLENAALKRMLHEIETGGLMQPKIPELKTEIKEIVK